MAWLRHCTTPADILILDEPTNHLDGGWWPGWRIGSAASGGLIMVTHDRYFLERVVNHITELSRGKLYHYEANYSKYLELKEQRAEMAEASERKRQSILRVEREWIMRGCRARSNKSKERIARYETLPGPGCAGDGRYGAVGSGFQTAGQKIIELDDVTKAFDGRTVVNHFSYNLLRGETGSASWGHNGGEKSTLLHLIADGTGAGQRHVSHQRYREDRAFFPGGAGSWTRPAGLRFRSTTLQMKSRRTRGPFPPIR